MPYTRSRGRSSRRTRGLNPTKSENERYWLTILVHQPSRAQRAPRIPRTDQRSRRLLRHPCCAPTVPCLRRQRQLHRFSLPAAVRAPAPGIRPQPTPQIPPRFSAFRAERAEHPVTPPTQGRDLPRQAGGWAIPSQRFIFETDKRLLHLLPTPTATSRCRSVRRWGARSRPTTRALPSSTANPSHRPLVGGFPVECPPQSNPRQGSKTRGVSPPATILNGAQANVHDLPPARPRHRQPRRGRRALYGRRFCGNPAPSHYAACRPQLRRQDRVVMTPRDHITGASSFCLAFDVRPGVPAPSCRA